MNIKLAFTTMGIEDTTIENRNIYWCSDCNVSSRMALNSSIEATFLREPTANSSDPIPLGIAVGGGVIGVVIIIMGIFGNSLIVLAIILYKPLSKASNLFVASLACCDLFQNVLVKPFYVHTYIVGEWKYGANFCVFELFASNLTILEGILHISAIALHRYVIIVHPRVSRYFQQTKAIIIMILVIYIAPMLVILLPSIRAFGRKYTMDVNVMLNPKIMFCSFVRPNVFRLSGVLKKCVFLFIAALFLAYCYVRIYLVVHRSGRELYSNGDISPSRINREMALLKTVIVIFSTFVAAYLPLSVMYGVDRDRSFTFSMYFVPVMLLWLSSSLSWITYGLMNRQYLEAYKFVLTGKRSSRHRQSKVTWNKVSTGTDQSPKAGRGGLSVSEEVSYQESVSAGRGDYRSDKRKDNSSLRKDKRNYKKVTRSKLMDCLRRKTSAAEMNAVNKFSSGYTPPNSIGSFNEHCQQTANESTERGRLRSVEETLTY